MRLSVDRQFADISYLFEIDNCKSLKVQIRESCKTSKIASLLWKLIQLLKSGKFDGWGIIGKLDYNWQRSISSTNLIIIIDTNNYYNWQHSISSTNYNHDDYN